MILVKVVLEIIHVYWLTLAKIPSSTLNVIRRLMLRFLWTSNKSKEGFHLSSWKTLSSPKHLGGWGFKKLPCFAKELSLKKLLESPI